MRDVPSSRSFRGRWPVRLAALALTALLGPAAAWADLTPQALPFSQDWSNTGLITTDDNWSGVPGIMGYRGDNLTSTTGTDPQTVLTEGTPVVDVVANKTSPNTETGGGVYEFEITDPVVALQGSGTADAPYLLITVSTTGLTNIEVSYNLRDIDGSADNTNQQVALQYRVGTSGSFVNLANGYVADASTGPSLATLVTPVSVILPSACENQATVQIRIITTNAGGSDEWIGVDDILVRQSPNPSGTGASSPSTVNPGDTTLLTVAAKPGANPPSAWLAVQADLSAIGGSATQAFYDDGTHGDATPGDLTFSYQATVGLDSLGGNASLPATVTDDQARTGACNIPLYVNPTLRPINQIQGSGENSPMADSVVKTRGVVTALTAKSFFIQTPDAEDDDNPATSDGLIVYVNQDPATLPVPVAKGDHVEVTGTLVEYVPASGGPALTEITYLPALPTITVLSSGNPMPAAIELTTTLPDPAGAYLQLERLEGMRVTVNPSLTAVSPTEARITKSTSATSTYGTFYAVVTGVARPFREPGLHVWETPPAGSPDPLPRFDGNPEHLRVNTLGQTGTTALDVTTGVVVSNVTGVLDFTYRTYTILPDATPTVGANSTYAAVRDPAGDEFTVASANLLRFYDTVDDPAYSEDVLTAAAYEIRMKKISLAIRNVLKNPDILAVEEMENLTTLSDVATRVNTDSGGATNYSAYLVEGNDAAIDVGFLVNLNRVAVVSVTQEGKDASWNGSNWTNDRPPLVLEATVSGQPVAVIVNHLRSNLDLLDTDFVRQKRRAQAEYLANLIQARQIADPLERLVVVGDFNAFEFSDAIVDVIGTVRGAPAAAADVVLASPDLVDPDLTATVDTLPASSQYSYTYDGSAQTIDHVLVDDDAFLSFRGVEYGRMNADFPGILYSDDTRPERLADHDPVVAYFQVALPPALSVGDASLTEGNSGPGSMTFTVTMDKTWATPVTVSWATTDGSAVAPGDYSSGSGIVTIPAGSTSGTFAVSVAGDTTAEHDETFTVTLSYAGGAAIAYGTATGTILNDDAGAVVDGWVFWRNGSSGENAAWGVGGFDVAAAQLLPTVAGAWDVVGAADLDGDDDEDLLWRDGASGDTAAWFMQDGNLVGGAILWTVPTTWQVAALADFDGNGDADLFWHSTTGETAVWLLDEGNVVDAKMLPTIATNWAVGGAGDFDGDGKADVLWRDQAAGQTAVWVMNGVAVADTGLLPDVTGDWEIAGLGDIDGDGKADVLWRTAAHDLAGWLMNGKTVGSAGVLPTVGGDWGIVDVQDLSGDGKADLFWREAASGENAVWQMNGLSVAASGPVTTLGSTSWHVVNDPTF